MIIYDLQKFIISASQFVLEFQKTWRFSTSLQMSIQDLWKGPNGEYVALTKVEAVTWWKGNDWCCAKEQEHPNSIPMYQQLEGFLEDNQWCNMIQIHDVQWSTPQQSSNIIKPSFGCQKQALKLVEFVEMPMLGASRHVNRAQELLYGMELVVIIFLKVRFWFWNMKLTSIKWQSAQLWANFKCVCSLQLFSDREWSMARLVALILSPCNTAAIRVLVMQNWTDTARNLQMWLPEVS